MNPKHFSCLVEVLRARDSLTSLVNITRGIADNNARDAYIHANWAHARLSLGQTAAGLVAGVRRWHRILVTYTALLLMSAAIAFALSTWLPATVTLILTVPLSVVLAAFIGRAWIRWRYLKAAAVIDSYRHISPPTVKTGDIDAARLQVSVAKSAILNGSAHKLEVPGGRWATQTVAALVTGAWLNMAKAVHAVEDHNTPPQHHAIEEDRKHLELATEVLGEARRLQPILDTLRRVGSTRAHAIAASQTHAAVESLTITAQTLGADPRVPGPRHAWRWVVAGLAPVAAVVTGITVLSGTATPILAAVGIAVAAQMLYDFTAVAVARIPDEPTVEDELNQILPGSDASIITVVDELCHRELVTQADYVDATAERIYEAASDRSDENGQAVAINLSAAAERLAIAGEQFAPAPRATK